MTCGIDSKALPNTLTHPQTRQDPIQVPHELENEIGKLKKIILDRNLLTQGRVLEAPLVPGLGFWESATALKSIRRHPWIRFRHVRAVPCSKLQTSFILYVGPATAQAC